ncbi:hypothetical protein T459_24266 [Capsicum annuum]|uniref:NB-ARC domain-containing protein n=1 Tax=Capsicum annuum TaxID=4072 RepID=A0A2G2YV18_CAPAN|nr:hypothetical protein T459_24266 [Capsicum annuum]
MDCIWKDSTNIQDKGKQVSKESLVHDFSSSTNDILNVNNNMVGHDDQKEHLLEDLTGSYSGEPKVIPIVEMGGIGKTTLAKEVYNHESVLCRFDICAWAIVSQQHNIKEILLAFCNRRSKWMTKLRQENLSWWMSFMDQDESWSLFKIAAFTSEELPYEFYTFGKQLADECHGLPLTIVVIAGILKSKRAIEDWESVAKDVNALKTCLLHFGSFPEDSEIPVKNLMRLWMGEGFLKLENDLEGECNTP